MNYLYVLKYNIEEAGMCAMEMRRVFHQDSTKKYFITEQKEDVTRSLFTKSRLDILLEADDFQELLEKIEAQKYDYQNYKTIYVQVEGYERTYEERCVLNREVGCIVSNTILSPQNFLELMTKECFIIHTSKPVIQQIEDILDEYEIPSISYDLADVHLALSAGVPIVLVDCCDTDENLQPIKSYRWFQIPKAINKEVT